MHKYLSPEFLCLLSMRNTYRNCDFSEQCKLDIGTFCSQPSIYCALLKDLLLDQSIIKFSRAFSAAKHLCKAIVSSGLMITDQSVHAVNQCMLGIFCHDGNIALHESVVGFWFHVNFFVWNMFELFVSRHLSLFIGF